MLIALLSPPLTQPVHIRRRAISEPGVELGLGFELLAARAVDEEEAAVEFVEAGHVASELFELSDEEDVFLAAAPALYDVLQGDVGRHVFGGRSKLKISKLHR